MTHQHIKDSIPLLIVGFAKLALQTRHIGNAVVKKFRDFVKVQKLFVDYKQEVSLF